MIFVKVEVCGFNELKELCWRGALDTLETIEEWGKEDELMDYLDDLYNFEPPTIDEVNDFLWFESDTIFYDLGIGSDEDNNEEDEDDE